MKEKKNYYTPIPSENHSQDLKQTTMKGWKKQFVKFMQENCT